MHKSSVLITFIAILFCSCASSDSFQHFYNQEKNDADIAVAFPKYMAMVAIPKEDKKEFKHFLKGMKKVRLLYDHEQSGRLLDSFKDFAKDKDYTPYFVVKKDGNKIDLFAKEEDNAIREIVLDIKSDEESIVVALMGKMDMSTFKNALKEASKD